MGKNSQKKSRTKKALIMDDGDGVAVALDDLGTADRVIISTLSREKVYEFEVPGPVAYGHKLSVKALAKGSEVIKNGEVIGIASQPISRGEHVHIHNVVSAIVPPPKLKSLKEKKEL